eukprot:m.1517851 g.1517851  ORF g.1517851 m.1517851 type:complete len:1260 (-) comp25219_c0_seq4:160-3939(-)
MKRFMKVIWAITGCLLVASRTAAKVDTVRSSTPRNVQQTAAQELVARVVGNAFADQFEVLVASRAGADGFTVEEDAATGKIKLTGTTGVEVARALNFYLNSYLNATYDWNTYAMGQLPSAGGDDNALPKPAGQSGLNRTVPYSYYMNVCTYGYSLPFIPWDTDASDPKAQSWVRHIDWMAMNDINLPLSFVGQEYVWSVVFSQYNITLEEQQEFYSGAAFLAWFRMGNMRGWGGPLSMEWMESRRDLQINILTRMRSLGMTPVLSAFAGHVPGAFQSKYPNVKISRSPNWANFNKEDNVTAPYADVFLVEPTDPMYIDIGSKFIAVQTKIYGSDHVYNCDTYNEMQPPTSDPTYLKAASAAVYKAMVQSDPDAIWLMQGWLFQNTWWKTPQIEAYLGGVPTAKMWLLDLFGDSNPIWVKTASFYGHPYIWCTLLNFGGQQGITGNVPQVTAGLQRALDNSTINGVGITMEGIWTNYPVFEITLQGAYRVPSSTAELTQWWAEYGRRRYGAANAPSAVAAWQLLGSTVYNGQGGGFGSDISSLPSMPSAPSPIPEPEAPAGFHTYSKRGYFEEYYTPDKAVQSVVECAEGCLATTAGHCLGFEVYITSAPSTGNCYWFFNISTPFFPLAPCATYLRDTTGHTQRTSPYTTSSQSESSVAASTASTFAQVWGQLLDAADTVGTVPSFRFDLVDVGREVIAANFSTTLSAFKQAFSDRDIDAVVALGGQLLMILEDYDLLLSSDTNFMLGRWLEWSKSWSNTTAGKANLEFNARNIITLWGPTGQINDYAKKEWGGLVRDYYAPRYTEFISRATTMCAANVSWDQATYQDLVLNSVSLPFQTAQNVYPVVPETDAVATNKLLYAKYVGAASNAAAAAEKKVTSHATCTSDEDCSLLGVCMAAGTCKCDPGWTGDDCGRLRLLPVVRGSGYNLTNQDPPVNSWGANIFPADDTTDASRYNSTSTWHMYAAEFENSCDISHWSPNSAIVHAVSSTGPLGPYKRGDVAVMPFAHNPKVARAPDGTWLMYTIGTPLPASTLYNCSKTPPSTAVGGTPGRTPKNLESNVTLFTSPSMHGPWTRFGIALGPNDEGTWDEDTSNPSPWVLPNGTVLLMYRGCVVYGGGCTKEYIGIASAPHWRGPYTRLRSSPVLPTVSAEDPSMWVDKRGHVHFLMHYIPDQNLVARHAFARHYTGPWNLHVDSIPYNTTLEYTDGTVEQLHKRERPQLVFDDDMTPRYFVSGAVVPGSNEHGYSGKSYTLIQEVDLS